MLALLVDITVIAAISTLLRSVANLVAIINLDFSIALSLIIYFIITIGYGIGLEWLWNGQTLGKRLLRLRVSDENGRKLLFSQIVIRNLLRFVDSMPVFYLVGGIATLLNRRAQRLGDLAAGTIVIRQPKISMPDTEQIGAVKYNSFSKHPYLEARLRSNVSPREASLALSALLRRNDLDDDARLIVFRELADRLKQIVDFPTEIIDDISDEQFIRNAVCSIYRLNTHHS